MNPAMTIQMVGELTGTPGEAMRLLLLTKELAAEHGLQQEASLWGHTLSVRLTVAKRAFPMKGQ